MIMTKTIEEAIKDGWNTCDKVAEMGSFDFYNTGFLNGVAHLRSLSLSDRLTEAEKERVREEYADNKCLIESASLSYVQREVFQKINETLEYIFGADFFKEGE